MLLCFEGTKPTTKYVRLGVRGNNLVDTLIVRLARVQKGIDLAQFACSLKMSNRDLTFADEVRDLEITVGEKELLVGYVAKSKVTVQGSVDMQLSFEKVNAETENDVPVWQTQIFNVAFDERLDINEPIENEYPDVLGDMEKRIAALEDRQARVEEYDDHFAFPNVGRPATLYIDKKNNKTYRYDTASGHYYIVGSDYEEIAIINANGGAING